MLIILLDYSDWRLATAEFLRNIPFKSGYLINDKLSWYNTYKYTRYYTQYYTWYYTRYYIHYYTQYYSRHYTRYYTRNYTWNLKNNPTEKDLQQLLTQLKANLIFIPANVVSDTTQTNPKSFTRNNEMLLCVWFKYFAIFIHQRWVYTGGTQTLFRDFVKFSNFQNLFGSSC